MRPAPLLTPGVRAPRRAFYFYRLNDQNQIDEFYVANHDDTPTDEYPAGQFVETVLPSGERVHWLKYAEGDLLVFRPPDVALIGGGVGWSYDRRVQIGEAAPRKFLERHANRGRVSV